MIIDVKTATTAQDITNEEKTIFLKLTLSAINSMNGTEKDTQEQHNLIDVPKIPAVKVRVNVDDGYEHEPRKEIDGCMTS